MSVTKDVREEHQSLLGACGSNRERYSGVNHSESVYSEATYSEEDCSDVIMVLPKDNYQIVYLSFYFLGLGTLLPWNFFITANDYWMYKLQSNSSINPTPSPPNSSLYSTSPSSSNISGTVAPTTPPVQYNSLQTLFQNALSICAMLPNVIFQFLNTILQRRIRESIRIVGSVTLMIMLFILTEVFVKIDTSSWQELFFAVTMICVIVMNSCSAVFQSSIFGISASLPPRYTQAVMAGQGMGGVFASCAMIAALAYTSDPTSSAFAYFMAAIVVLLFTVVCYLLLRKSVFFSHYRSNRKASMSQSTKKPRSASDDQTLCDDGPEKLSTAINATGDVWLADETAVENKEMNPLSGDEEKILFPKTNPPLLKIFKKIWRHCFCVIFTFFVTLACFPSITSGVQSMTSGHDWNDIYFTPVCCFLLFNLTDWIGRSMAGYVHIPSRNNTTALLVCVVARGAFLVLFALCNVQPRTTPVIFANDAIFIVFMVLFGISNGHLSTLSMQYGPLMMDTPENASTAGSMLAFTISVGLFAGAGFSFVIKLLL